MEKSNIYKSNGFVLFGLKYQQDQSWPKHETNSSIFLEILLSILYINPESEPTCKLIAGRRQVCLSYGEFGDMYEYRNKS